MDLDTNIKAHDLLWRLMEPAIKRVYTESYGKRQSDIVETEMEKLVENDLVYKTDGGYELTSKGHSIYNLLTRQRGCCQPG